MKKDNIYHIEVKYDSEEGGFVARIPALHNIAALGQTEEEAISSVIKIQKDYLKFLAASKKEIPKSDKN